MLRRVVRRQPWQPGGVALDLSRRPLDARQTHDQVVTESPDRVVGPPRLGRIQRQVGESRQLCREKSADQRLVDFDLAAMHPDRHVNEPRSFE